MNRFQWFLVFCKAENLLFHLETTVLCNFVFLVEKKHILEENVELLLENASLDMSELEQYDQCWAPNVRNYSRYAISTPGDP